MQISDAHIFKLYFVKFVLENHISFKKRCKDCVRTTRKRGMKLKKINEEVGFQTRGGKKKESET